MMAFNAIYDLLYIFFYRFIDSFMRGISFKLANALPTHSVPLCMNESHTKQTHRKFVGRLSRVPNMTWLSFLIGILVGYILSTWVVDLNVHEFGRLRENNSDTAVNAESFARKPKVLWFFSQKFGGERTEAVRQQILVDDKIELLRVRAIVFRDLTVDGRRVINNDTNWHKRRVDAKEMKVHLRDTQGDRRRAFDILTRQPRTFAYKGCRVFDTLTKSYGVPDNVHEMDMNTKGWRNESHANAVPAFRQLMEDFGRQVLYMIDAYSFILDSLHPSGVVLWNGLGRTHGIVRSLAIGRNVSILAMERTMLESHITHSFHTGIAVNRGNEHVLWHRYKDSQLAFTDAQALAYAAHLREERLRQKAGKHVSPSAADSTALFSKLKERIGKRRLIVMLGQVISDTSLHFMIGGGFVGEADVLWTIARYAAKHGDDVFLFVKFHPQEVHNVDVLPTTTKTVVEAQGWFEMVGNSSNVVADTDNQWSTDLLMERADVVVTISSWAGLEALLLGREVITCGDTFYSHIGQTHDADDAASLHFHLDQVLFENSRRVRETIVARFVYMMFHFVAVPRTDIATIASWFNRLAMSE